MGETGGVKDDRERPPLRKFLLEGDFFVGAALAGTLTKLALRFADAVASEAKGQIKANRFIGEAMLVLASVLHLGQSGLPSKAITNDDADRIALCLKEIFNKECREALIEMIEAQGASEILSTNKKKNLALNTQAAAPIRFSQLSKTNDL